ncbi:T9SS type B sorting domain-containing protein [Tamlana sp. 2_MG-2023]|uniref:T9SS type B sorting domain-containing protein n=1 Tax=unclassified Tamlana TaxID=2614803 RepID=UPI0026E343B3|nr:MULTISPECIES: T9SS type B sorting domain-containing protein [unclassified Tamlana]MDO6761466.1 T9SS type B sorting domain-containing protein [Tamlana sp. 2_MG-2023]MDO6792359.1 T9SS type B sorting domain-containing protein [Tamlana sp. 1_MG-2023]
MIKFNLKKMFFYVFFLLVPICIWSQDVKVELTFTYQNTPVKTFTVNDLIVIDLPTAATATWYDAPSGGNLLLPTEPLVSGQIYYLETIPAAGIGTRLQTIVYEVSPSLEADKSNDVCLGEQVTISAKDLLTNEQFEIENTNGIGLGLTKITDYGDSSYFVKEDKMSWEDAYTLINAIPGAAMYIINDTSEEGFVFNELTNLGLADPGDANAFWLGLKQFASAVDFDDTVNQTGWYWIDGTPMGYTNWSADEPNDYRDAPSLAPPYQLYDAGGINDEDYGQFDFQARGVQWNDAPNDSQDRNSFPIFEFTGISGLQWYQLNTTTNTYEVILGETNGDLQITASELSQKYRLEFLVNGITSSLDYEVQAVDVQIFPIASNLTTACDDEVDPLLQDGVYAFDTSTFESTLLNGQMGMTISYTDENGLPLLLTNPLNTGTQSINVRIESNSNASCFTTGTIDFVVNALPKIKTNTDGSEDVTICFGSTTTLDAGIADGSPETDYTYEWSKDGTVISPVETNQTLIVDTDGDYTVEVTSIASGCSATRNINVVVTQDPQPAIECWETATFNNTTCTWDVTGTQETEPVTECWETATFNDTTCTWDVTGTQESEPVTECWETATFDSSTCTWVVSGSQPDKPTGLECWQTAMFNDTTCSWDVVDAQSNPPTDLECWETATFDSGICDWVVKGIQPDEPTGLFCWETTTFNNTICSWDIIGGEPLAPTDLACWETATFDSSTCTWVVSGSQPDKPTGLECWQTAMFNDTTCSWDVVDAQSNPPTDLECWQTATFDSGICDWVVTGTQPDEPTGLECWQTAIFNDSTCSWDVVDAQSNPPTDLECWETATFDSGICDWVVTGTQPDEPTGLSCWETTTFNNTTCSWDIIGGEPVVPTGLACWETATFDSSTCAWIVSGTKPDKPTGLECWETAEFDKSTCSWLVTGSKQIETLNFELCSNQALELYATTVVSNPSYKWSTGEVSDRIFVTTGGTYTVQISDGSCVVSEITYNVTPIAAPSIQSVVSDADKIIINTTTNGDFLYSLEGDIYQSSNIFYNIPAGLYTIHVKEAFCNDVDTKEHFHFYIPKFFTPNHDGFNDTFEIKGLEFFGSSEVSIFNRYGKLLKHVINNSFSWDGRYNGTEQRTDDYWYVVIVDGKKITGHVTLKR